HEPAKGWCLLIAFPKKTTSIAFIEAILSPGGAAEMDQSNRRDFLKQAGLTGVGFWVAGGLAQADNKSPNEKLNIACVGVGGKGSSDTDHAGKLANVVALCDIDDKALGKKAEKFPKAKK